MRHVRATALLLVAVATAGVAFATAAQGAGLARFEVRPAFSNPLLPASRIYFSLHDAAGSAHRHTVLVSNRGSAPITLSISPVDALTAPTSGVIYTTPGATLAAAGRWVRADRSSVRVPARRSKYVTFVVHVPRAATPGDYVAGLAFQQTGSVILRAVIGIEIDVSGRTESRMAVDGLALGGAPHTGAAVIVTLANVGRALCQPRLIVSLARVGAVPLRYSQQLATVIPGSVIDYPFAWPGSLRPGSYQVGASATSCGPAVTIQGVLRLAHAISAGQRFTGAAVVARLSKPKPAGVSGWLYALLGVLVVLALLAYTRSDGSVRRSRREPPSPPLPDPPPPVVVADPKPRRPKSAASPGTKPAKAPPPVKPRAPKTAASPGATSARSATREAKLPAKPRAKSASAAAKKTPSDAA
jgi:hypothetical protein